MRAALVKLGAELEYDPDGEMVIGRRPGADAAEQRVRACLAHVLSWEFSTLGLTLGQLELLAYVNARRRRTVGKKHDTLSTLLVAFLDSDPGADVNDVQRYLRRLAEQRHEIILAGGAMSVNGQQLPAIGRDLPKNTQLENGATVWWDARTARQSVVLRQQLRNRVKRLKRDLRRGTLPKRLRRAVPAVCP